MKCDLTCPVEVVRVQISVETGDNGAEQVVCDLERALGFSMGYPT